MEMRKRRARASSRSPRGKAVRPTLSQRNAMTDALELFESELKLAQSNLQLARLEKRLSELGHITMLLRRALDKRKWTPKARDLYEDLIRACGQERNLPALLRALAKKRGRPRKDEVATKVHTLKQQGKSWSQISQQIKREMGVEISKDACRQFEQRAKRGA